MAGVASFGMPMGNDKSAAANKARKDALARIALLKKKRWILLLILLVRLLSYFCLILLRLNVLLRIRVGRLGVPQRLQV